MRSNHHKAQLAALDKNRTRAGSKQHRDRLKWLRSAIYPCPIEAPMAGTTADFK